MGIRNGIKKKLQIIGFLLAIAFLIPLVQASGTVNDSGGNWTVIEAGSGSVNDSGGNWTAFFVFGGTVNDSGGNWTVNDIVVSSVPTKEEPAPIAEEGGGGGAALHGFNISRIVAPISNISGVIALELPENFWTALNTPISIPIPLPDGEWVVQVKPIALIALFFLVFTIVLIIRFMRKK